MLDKIKQFFAVHDDIIALIVLIIGACRNLPSLGRIKLTLGGGLALLKGKSTGNG